MKHIIMTFLLFVICQIGFGQTELCNAIIYWKYEGIVKIYNEPNGIQLTSLQNDLKNNDFLDLKIKETKNGFFCIEIGLSMGGTTYLGWIEKGEHIGAFMKIPNEYLDLTFYSEPSDESQGLIEVKNWKAGFVTIEECNAEWTKVSINHDGKRITGWIESEKLCANNYTTCG